MASKFDRLRAGEVVEIEPGRKGRLNLEDKSFETSDGRKMYVGDDPDFFPSDENALAYSREKEGLQKEINRTPGGEFLHQFGTKGIAGAAKNWYNKLTKHGDDYTRSMQVNADVANQISEESPYTSAAATAASFLPDIALTKGMSAIKAAPALTALHAGPRIIEEPMQVAGEALTSAAGGFLIDKGASVLNRMAQRRGQVRALPGQQQAVNEANTLQNEKFNILKQDIKNVNETRLVQHQKDLNDRQNKMIQASNTYEKAKFVRDREVLRLKNEYEIAKSQRSAETTRLENEYQIAKSNARKENQKLHNEFKKAQTEYKQALKDLPNIQKKAQEEYSANVIKNANEISNVFPTESKIFSAQLGIDDFIENSIQKTGLAGSSHANQASKILKSLFQEGENFNGKMLASRYKALEEAIQKSPTEVKQILNEFKTHLGEKIPTLLADNLAFSRISPTLKKQIQKEIDSVLNSMQFASSGIGSRAFVKNKITSNIENLFNQISPENFIEKMKSGELRKQISENIIKPTDFTFDFAKNLRKVRKIDVTSIEELQNMGINVQDPSLLKYEQFSNLFNKKLDKIMENADIKMIGTDIDAANKLGKKVGKTFGLAETVAAPNKPSMPQFVNAPNKPNEIPAVTPPQLPPNIAPPNTPPLPGKPSLLPPPQMPTEIPSPTLAPASGLAEQTADFLEKPLLGNTGKGMANNTLLKLGGLKYLLGKAALPAEAAYGAMRGLTSPTQAGQIARISFERGGIQAVESWAQKYPSYHNGILESPIDRRSFTREIEDDPSIPLEQKAIFQSKINRGKPLSTPL